MPTDNIGLLHALGLAPRVLIPVHTSGLRGLFLPTFAVLTLFHTALSANEKFEVLVGERNFSWMTKESRK